MLTQTDIERERYDARQKAQRDYNSAIGHAQRQGEMIGAIRICEQMLQRPETPVEQLRTLSLAELTRRMEDLKGQAMHRR